ncbi:hypothetical protein OHD62_03675 [Mesorhizobium sp. YC-39]|uniref:hypothetical protein n=1 Tax=unclassified Mesorhizobium TaxID=325217 RepID=UPI0021E8BF0D|nr:MULTISPECIES: hypothetical protein [unclassified Mesorhizobium]MCV3206138.1 hypothetical protein [Mesorhizobium sp. YC-2]MCV3227462.1 hypothetical protein [Mesorhizobium sp. YC-39]
MPDDLCVDRNFTLIKCFLEEHRMSCRARSVLAVWEDGKQEQWRLHCFADAGAAKTFLDHFGGMMFDPKLDRENGRARGTWRRQGAYERILELGPLSVPEILRN